MGPGYRLFRNVHISHVDSDTYAFYNPLSGHGVVFADSDVYEQVTQSVPLTAESLPKSVFERLLEGKFLVPGGFDDDIPLRNAAKQYGSSSPRIGLMYLILSEQCNYACTYCFVEGNMPLRSPKSSMMSVETCSRAIDYYVRVVDKQAQQQVILYGGEPLLNREVFRVAVERLREEEHEGNLRNLVIVLNTNASMVDEETAEFCSRHKVVPAVSIDGMRDIHDACRIGGQGEKTFDRTLRGYRLLMKHGAKPNISCTVSAVNASRLEEVVDYFIRELDLVGLGFNLLVDFGDQANPENVDIGIATDNMLKAFAKLREHGIYEDRIMRRLTPFVNGSIYMKDCAGYGNQIVVAPDGQIGPCHGFLGTREFFTWNINSDCDFDVHDDPTFNLWNDRHPFNMPACRECSMISLCGGGCAYQAYVANGDLFAKDERICTHSRMVLDWMLGDLWRQKRTKLGRNT